MEEKKNQLIIIIIGRIIQGNRLINTTKKIENLGFISVFQMGQSMLSQGPYYHKNNCL